MSRVARYARNIGWLGMAQTLLAVAALTLLAVFEALQQHWNASAIWSPLLFFVPLLFVRTHTIIFHMSWLQLLMRTSQAIVLGLLIVGIFAFNNYAAFLDFMIPAAWFSLGLSFWVLSHSIVMTKRRSMIQAARNLGRRAPAE